jgi:hypothetical protein
MQDGPRNRHTRRESLESRVRGALGKAGISLPVKVRSGQSRANRPAASLAGAAVTRRLKRRQQVHGVCGLNPEIGLVTEAELALAPAKAAWPSSTCERAAAPSGAKSRSRAYG